MGEVFGYVCAFAITLFVAGFGALSFLADGMDPTGRASGLPGCGIFLAGAGAFAWLVWSLF